MPLKIATLTFPRPGSDNCQGLPERQPFGTTPFRAALMFGPYATNWVQTTWKPHETRKTLDKRIGKKGKTIFPRSPGEQIIEKRGYFQRRLKKIEKAMAVAKANYNDPLWDQLALKANECQFRIDELHVMQFYLQAYLNPVNPIVDPDTIRELQETSPLAEARRNKQLKLEKH